MFTPRTRTSIRPRMLAAVPAAMVTVALLGTPSLAATPAVGAAHAGPAPATQGIIMRDGGVCDPIRHMGC
jgi:hypothetical protein